VEVAWHEGLCLRIMGTSRCRAGVSTPICVMPVSVLVYADGFRNPFHDAAAIGQGNSSAGRKPVTSADASMRLAQHV
jgi:hypothetical protein